jgi:hypothetical protein
MVIIAGFTILPERDRDRYVAVFRDLVERARVADRCIDVPILDEIVTRVNATDGGPLF